MGTYNNQTVKQWQRYRRPTPPQTPNFVPFMCSQITWTIAWVKNSFNVKAKFNKNKTEKVLEFRSLS